MEDASELRYKNHVRIMSEIYVRFMSGNYVIKSCKWEQKIRNHYAIDYVILTSL